MTKNFTQPNLLLLYAYNETDLAQSDSAQRLIDGDPLIAEEYSQTTKAINLLNEFVANPSEHCIKAVLMFAEKQ